MILTLLRLYTEAKDTELNPDDGDVKKESKHIIGDETDNPTNPIATRHQ